MAKTIPMGCLVDKELHKEFQKMANDNDRTIASEIRIAMKNSLQKHNQKKMLLEKIKHKKPTLISQR